MSELDAVNHYREQFVAQALESANPILIEWFGSSVIRENLDRAIDADGAPASAANIAIKPQVESDCGLRLLIDVDRHGVVLAEGRTQADNMQLPHVVVRQSTFDLLEGDALDRTSDAVRGAFASLRPSRLCMFVHGSAAAASARLRGQAGMALYKRYPAIPLRELIRQDPPTGPPDKRAADLELKAPSSLDFYDRYARAYAAFWASHPILEPLVRQESEAAMASYLAQGLLRIIHIEGEWAGVIAAAREYEYGLGGYCMHERLLEPRFRGHGFGSAILNHFARTLPGEESDALWGTIVPDNQASMRSAERAGRIDIGGLYWIDLEGPP